MFGRAEFNFELDGRRTPYFFAKGGPPKGAKGAEALPDYYYTAEDRDDRVRLKIENEKGRGDHDLFYKMDILEKARDGILQTQEWRRADDGAVVATLEAELVLKKGK